MQEHIDFDSLSKEDQQKLLNLNEQASRELALERKRQSEKDSTPHLEYHGYQVDSAKDIDRIKQEEDDWQQNQRRA